MFKDKGNFGVQNPIRVRADESINNGDLQELSLLFNLTRESARV